MPFLIHVKWYLLITRLQSTNCIIDLKRNSWHFYLIFSLMVGSTFTSIRKIWNIIWIKTYVIWRQLSNPIVTWVLLMWQRRWQPLSHEGASTMWHPVTALFVYQSPCSFLTFLPFFPFFSLFPYFFHLLRNVFKRTRLIPNKITSSSKLSPWRASLNQNSFLSFHLSTTYF